MSHSPHASCPSTVTRRPIDCRSVSAHGGLLLLLVAATPASVLAQSTIHVPADKTTIQQAIDASSNGDTILVAAGTYRENLDFKGKAVALLSEQGPASTIIDGQQVNSVLTFQTSETTATRISGFTIQNGNGSFGSGVNALGASPTLVDNIFQANAGGAIWGNSSSMVLERNLFTNHTCYSQDLFAVVSFVNSSSPIIKDNVFVNNHCPAIDISLPTGNVPYVANNTIVNNDIGLQIDARVPKSSEIYRNNLIYGNGVGVNVLFGSIPNYPTLENSLVFGSSTANYQGIPDQTGSGGNLSADPLLTGLVAGDYHPDSGSPAIDAGLNAAVSSGEVDYYGGTRVLDGGSGAAVVDIGAVEYATAPPAVTVSGSVASIALGGTATLNWSSLRSTACVAGGAWSGSLALSGSQVVTPSTAGTLTYTVTCTGAGGARLGSVSLIVYPPPMITISISPSSIPVGKTATVSWSTITATSCTETGTWTGAAGTSGSRSIGPPAAGNYSYGLTCVGPGGTSSSSATLVVNPLPVLNFSLNPTTVAIGASASLSWSSTNTTGCTASHAWSGSQPTSGTASVGPLPAGTYQYTLACSGPGGTTTLSEQLTVVPLPAVTISVHPLGVPLGAPATLTWSSSGATGCQASGAWTGTLSISGSRGVTPAAAGISNYSITCTGPGGSATAAAQVAVYTPPVATISVNPESIATGGSATLTWSSSNTSSCSISNALSQTVSASGNQAVTPSAPGSYTYELTCSGPGGSATSTTQLTVNAKPGGGGGGLDFALLALLTGFAVVRVARATACEA